MHEAVSSPMKPASSYILALNTVSIRWSRF